jgi:Holliday junction resolvasome RuvABC DNA-binding subunit
MNLNYLDTYVYANIIAQIDIPAVAKHFGIKNKAAQMRYSRLKKKLDEMEASNEEAHGKDKDTEDEGDTMSD